ncbi:MAG: hypothetical protein JO356_09890, partial [Acidobacteria bacterium]|nr:hypothetical protein [Acidobacteriota bacterium]
MRSLFYSLLLLTLVNGSLWAKQEQAAPLFPCPVGTSEAACNPSPQDQKAARVAFARGVKLKERDPDLAYEEFSHAANLVPRNVDYVTAREVSRQQLVSRHLERGNSELETGKEVEALADFRSALQLDPSNAFAQERLRVALGDSVPETSAPPKVIAESPVINLLPATSSASFHFRGDARELFEQIAHVYGVSAEVEDSVPSRRVSFDIDNVDFYKAMLAADSVAKTFWVPLDGKQMLIALDSPDNRQHYQRMAMRTFYVPGAATSPQGLNDVVNLLRNLFDIRWVTPNAGASTIVVRAPQVVLDAVTQLLEHLDSSRPQVMLEIKVYQVNHSLLRNLGVHIPNQFRLFNIPAGALAALGGQNIQQLINQLISSGAINQANNQAISALLAQLQGQQNSIFSQPLATFGGGKTLTGVSLDQLSGQLSLNEGWVKTLDHAMLRAAHGTDTTFRMGSRYPVLNATFAPIFNSSAISQVLQNNSFQAAFPSVSYEELGLTIKAKPSISPLNDIALQLDINLRALSGASINGVPVIGNREYQGSITLVDGEPAVVAGQVTHSETLALSGI